MRAAFTAAALTLVSLLLAAGPAAACLPYTFGDDEWNLERGVTWAIRGTVIGSERNPDVPERPRAMIIRVDELIVGRPAAATFRIEQSGSCDGFWYGPGDSVVAALPAYDHFHDPPLQLDVPPERLENDSVAVWVIDGGRVVSDAGRSPLIGGRRVSTVDELAAALIGLPDTAVGRRPETSSGTATPAIALAAGVAGLLVSLLRLDDRRRRHVHSA